MFRLVLISLVGLVIAAQPALTQQGGPDFGPIPQPAPAAPQPPEAVRRLPPVEQLPPPPAEAAPPQAPPAVKLWEGCFEFGLDGATGNTETLSFRLGFDAKRKTAANVLSLDVDYSKKTNRGQETANRAFLDWRYEQLFQQSRWTDFVHGTVEHDKFRAFDLRVTADLGVGYRLIFTEATTWTARCGGGFSHEIGSPDEQYVPEAVFGTNFEHRLGKRRKLSAGVDYMPDVTDFARYRIRSSAGWEVLIDEQMNLSLKLMVHDRYDSMPHGSKPNDLDYAAVLLWKF